MTIKIRLKPPRPPTELNQATARMIDERAGKEIPPFFDRTRQKTPFPDGIVAACPAVVYDEEAGETFHNYGLLGGAEAEDIVVVYCVCEGWGGEGLGLLLCVGV